MAASDTKFDFSTVAFKKAYLHAIKYLTDDIVGVLTGRFEGSTLKVTNCYPLFHTRVLLPTLETALEIIEALSTPKGDVVIGFYESLAKPNQEGEIVSEISTRILEGITEKLGKDPIVLKFQDLTEEQENEEEIETKIDLQVFQFTKRPTGDIIMKNVTTQLERPLDFEAVEAEIKKGSHRKIVDFDNHFENIELDFRNEFIN